MTTIEAIWLGVVQGLTEFLPVSSSGHLVVFQTLLGVGGDGNLVFEVAVHVATLFAIVAFYRRRIESLIVGVLKGEAAAWRYGAKLAVATLPAVAVALAFGDVLDDLLSSPGVAGLGLLVTGGILWTTRGPKGRLDEPSWLGAFLIGWAQALAILPGISRSGTTVAACMALGIAPVAAAEFSFLLGVVAIAGAAVLTVPDLQGASPEVWSAIAWGGGAALVSGLAAIWLFLQLLKRQHFHYFAYYTWAAGAAFLGFLALQS